MSNPEIAGARAGSNPTHVRLERFPQARAVLSELEPLQNTGRQLIGAAAILDGIATAGLAFVAQARRVTGGAR